MKKLLIYTGLITVLGISTLVGNQNVNNEAKSEATPGVYSIVFTKF